MPLSQEQTTQVQNWLNQNARNFNCTTCNANNWQIGDIVAAPAMDQGGNINIGGRSVPMVQVICGQCAHIELFAAVPIGLVG